MGSFELAIAAFIITSAVRQGVSGDYITPLIDPLQRRYYQDSRPITGQSPLLRSKRNVLNLHYMMMCASSCNPWDYIGYGCHCGLSTTSNSNSVEYFMDEIDSCCKVHDECYAKTTCRAYEKYWFAYGWECSSSGEPECDRHQGFWAWFLRIKTCSQRACECDRALAKCLQQHPCPTSKLVCREL